ncbi:MULTISPECIES: lysylphosphatidylglycerol synthase transmembrane domain-containing protein [unclassified Mucilaginibacter]|uniref:lysylphosphatidylglycerol synthase transmembrane domain-containing protein n=1 Tax=unclassified Mucilaginibacter TaxID=2617802 RepID=UPI002AC95E45|nr:MULTISPECIES: lysylphosphatidylglycerol synthase transmembrane domain-containing protein [unclassified Mucilaginibacter]MEB0263175.1 lysylphosphatidylglycerol synthase transmembrane domain-containing protein [Mucilaginibacter sp. 10I4]MEB0278145.1 lysylphosphatidylglycerol synthase transmembrane domain-containing protein [Mucilaginibacter sp. 10B2]MEB0301379.1 lysylphosphatidylglycerol synthase transmembrane domain-containing protein [Mucilaginibacter sp. 5C4]WPX23057.1 lysylphosphatidylglyc
MTQNTQQTAEPEKQDAKSVFNRKVIIKGAFWFALITVATIAVVFFYNNTGDTLKALSHISYKYIAICIVMLFVDLMLGSWRNHIYIRKLAPGLSHWVSFRANVANMFMGAVTPAHGGAGPAQIFVYTSNGVTFIDSFAVTLLNLGATLIFMPLAGFIAIMLMDTTEVGSVVPGMLKYGFSFFLLFLLAFLMAFWKPLWVGTIIKKIAKGLSKIFPKRKEELEKWADNTFQSISKYQQTCSVIIRKHPYLFPLSLLITTVLYLNKYCLQWVLLMGLGISVNLVQVISIQILIQFMIYFAPTPGGSGFAEGFIATLFGKIVPAAFIPVFTLLQRSFLLFFPALIGAYVVLNLLRKQTMKKA